MQALHSLLLTLYQHCLPWLKRCYQYPLLSGVFLSVLTSLYLISDFGVVNRSALSLLWDIQHANNPKALDTFGALIHWVSQRFDSDVITAAHWIMVISHAVLAGLLLAIAKQLFFSKMTRWALIFLLLAHPSYNDYRAYIIAEPLFWCCWLLAMWLLLRFYKTKTVLAIVMWLVIFLLATNLTVAAWFWLFVFPFGALFFKPWRRKSVAYALLGYAATVSVLLFLPVYQGGTPIEWISTTVVNNPNSLVELLGLNETSDWVKEENTLMAGIFVFSGATSLVLIRSVIVFGVVCVGLAAYALARRQYEIVDGERLRILMYSTAFGIFIAVILFVLEKDSESLVSFSVLLLLFLLSALGLSYTFKKMALERYSRLSVLVIVWCLVAYFASGFIIFGPRKDYLNQAGQVGKQLVDLPVYSNDRLFLFYAGENPNRPTSWGDIQATTAEHRFYYAYGKNRNRELPERLQQFTPIDTFSNQRGDQLLLYRFGDD